LPVQLDNHLHGPGSANENWLAGKEESESARLAKGSGAALTVIRHGESVRWRIGYWGCARRRVICYWLSVIMRRKNGRDLEQPALGDCEGERLAAAGKIKPAVLAGFAELSEDLIERHLRSGLTVDCGDFVTRLEPCFRSR
jgi:hypothetical protein